MKLIKEQVNDIRYVLTEDAKTGKKEPHIEGIFLQSEVKNKNGRMYPRHILDKEVNRYNTDYVNKNRAFGELGHPDSPTINLDRVSHMITSLRPDGNNFIGKAKILDTPNGKIVKSLLDGGASLGVSTRGVGSLRAHNGYQLVQDDFHLATAADIVADPSAPDAWVRGLMEGVDWILENGKWTACQYDNAKKIITEANRKDIEEIGIRLFRNYINSL